MKRSHIQRSSAAWSLPRHTVSSDPELARRLRQEGVTTGPAEEKRLPILLNGQEAMWVKTQGSIIIAEQFANDPEAGRVYETVRGLSYPVYEYNDVVLAGQELKQNLGYQFVTWRRSFDRTAVVHGNFYYNDYDGAKLDFACRSELVQDSRQFTDEQLTELYRCIHETLESGYPITGEREDRRRSRPWWYTERCPRG